MCGCVCLQAVSPEASEQTEEDVVPNTPSLMTVSSRGFIKRMPSSTWEAQRRGGKGKHRQQEHNRHL
jgi:DNA gyrase/topoisomerase IV subunit A